VIEDLKSSYELRLIFFNPNIHPEQEWLKRHAEFEKYAKKLEIPVVSPGSCHGSYAEDAVKEWFNRIKGLEDAPEGGERCAGCFRYRLEITAKAGSEHSCDEFATTLTVSPHKNSKLINQIGLEIGELYGIQYHESDFKKKDGYKKMCEMSTREGMYRQDYCGCVFSIRKNR
jgi:predicted adenine nucleotide alpha hydrolase (AANH) superfamily ATPase